MPSDGTILITDIGHAKINAAVSADSKVEISHVALGDGNGAVYAPVETQTALKQELARVAIKSRHVGGDNTWVIKAEFDAETTPAFWVREIAFIDTDGDVIFLWAGADISPRQTGAIDYLIEHALNLDRIKDGVVIVAAPDDAVFDLAVFTAQNLATLHLEQFRQSERIRELHGAY